MISQPKAIQTRYAGCHFRSRLEARWAVFFDSADIKWEYEKEGYDLREYWDENLSPLGFYLPDFWLPDYGIWIEIKGSLPDDCWRMSHPEAQMVALISETRDKKGFIFFGLPDLDTPMSAVIWTHGVSDGRPPLHPDRNYGTVVDLFFDRVLSEENFIAAKSARFEFGAKGA